MVGYLSAAFFRGIPPQNVKFEAHAKELVPEEADTLLHLAYESARTPPGSPLPILELRLFSPTLRAPGRAFVTLHRGNELRGCVGYVDAARPLWETVALSARAAAHEDSRFPPVEPEEMPEMTVEVSILGEPRLINRPEEVVTGRHGVIVSKEGRQGLLLPQAANEHGWDRETMLSHACRKAGLPADAWKEGARIMVFEAQIFQAEPGPTALNGGS